MDILIAGQTYPVTEKFKAEVLDNHPDLSDLPYEELTRLRDAILKVSDLRNRYMLPTPKERMAPGGTLTLTELARLEAIVHVINVHHAVNFLRGRDHAEFGFDGVDQVHGNAHTAPCGCVLHVVFDHHQRHQNPTLHPHYPKASCDGHAHLVEDFRAHHAAVRADNAPPAE